MQPSEDRPALPHAQSSPLHWGVTAVALAVACGGAALLQPADASASASAAAPVGAPDAQAATYPVECGPYEVAVTHEAAVDLDGDGRGETVAAVRCDAAGGTPPSGLYVLVATEEPGAPPRVAATLLDPQEQLTVDRVWTSPGTVSARLLGYSSPDVPRAQPDRQRTVTWVWRDGRLELETGPPVTGRGV